MKSYLFFIGSLIVPLFCAAHNKLNEHLPHYKPGANVVFTHNYVGSSKAGEFDHLELQFTSRSQADGAVIKITLNPSSALNVVEGLHYEITPKEHSAHLPITLEGKQTGRHYLGIQTEIIDAGGRSSFRIFELPIQVGNVNTTNTRSHEKLSETKSGRKLRILKSDEKITSN